MSRNEKDGRAVLDEIWQKPKKAKDVIEKATDRNMNVFEFEKTISVN